MIADILEVGAYSKIIVIAVCLAITNQCMIAPMTDILPGNQDFFSLLISCTCVHGSPKKWLIIFKYP